MSRIIMGIDPGACSGIACVDTVKQCILMQTTVYKCHKRLSNWPLIIKNLLGQWQPDMVIIQSPVCGGSSPVWNRNAAALLKNANLAEAMMQEVARFEFPVRKVPPRRGSGCKMNLQMWRKIFQWEGKLPSEHARDAACLCLTAPTAQPQWCIGRGRRWHELKGG